MCRARRDGRGRWFLFFFFYIINNRCLSLLLLSSIAPGRPARRQKRSTEDDWNAASSSPYHHLPLRPSKSLNYSRNRSNSSDSINDLAESLVATDDAVVESPYSDHLRSSSYALLRPPGQPQQQPMMSPTPPSGPQSMLLPSVIASRFSMSGMATPYGGGGGGQQSMPYVSSSMLIEGNPQNRMLPKTPRTCELEEYARRYEAMQRGNASRRRISQAHANDPSAAPPPSVPAAGVNFWQKRPSLQHEPHYMRSSSGVWGSAAPSVVTSASGRDSVATVLTNSSSETVKYQDLVMAEQSMAEQQNQYQNTQQLQAYLQQQQQHQQQQMEYASLPPEPRVQKDLKKFPLHTYPSLSTIGDEAEYAAAVNKENNASNASNSNGSSSSSGSSASSSAVYARPHKMRHQMSERSMMAATPESLLHHSKSVPNLIPADEPPSPEENPSGEASFSFLDPDKRMRVTDGTLKLIQKQALLDYYARHSTTSSGGGGRRKSAAPAGSEHPDSGFYSPTEKAKQHQLANVDVHRAADQKQVGIKERKPCDVYNLGRQLEEKVLLYVFCKFPLLAWAAWQLQYSPTACGTLGKHFTKPFLQVAAPECRNHATMGNATSNLSYRSSSSFLPLFASESCADCVPRSLMTNGNCRIKSQGQGNEKK